MTASGRRLDRLADLEEQRDFLLRSLDDLEREYSSGEVDEAEYATLRDDYTRRTADTVRSIESDLVLTTAGTARPGRRWLSLVGVAVVAIVAGVLIAQSLGQRSPGGAITGDIDRSVRTRVAEARDLFFSGDNEGAREIVDGVLVDDRDLADALLLSAQINAQEGEVLPALQELDVILDGDPEHIDALTLRGWILVRIPDEDLVAEGIESLDAAIALGPTIPDPFMFRGVVAREMEGDLAAAIGYYEQALERSPPEPMVDVIEGVISEMRAALEASGS